MKCRDIEKWLNSNDTVSRPPAFVQDHLISCSGCRQKFTRQEMLEQAVFTMRSMTPDLTRPELLTGRILACIEKPGTYPANTFSRFLIRPVTRFALTGLMFMAGLTWLFQEIQVMHQVTYLEAKMESPASGIKMPQIIRMMGSVSETISGYPSSDLAVLVTRNGILPVHENEIRLNTRQLSLTEMLKLVRTVSTFRTEYPRLSTSFKIRGSRQEVVVKYTGGIK